MSHITHLLIIQLAIAMAPFAVWGLVVIAAKIWGARLRGIVPWLRVLSWAVWGRWPADCFPCDILGLPSLAYAIRRDHRQFWISRWKSVALGKEAICSRTAG
jgi:hypothetical protein